MDSHNINPFQLFKEEVVSEEISVRVNAVRRLPTVVTALGKNIPALSQLLAFLDTLIATSDDDEVLFGLSESIYVFVDYVEPQQLLPLLERLVAVEETIVREKSVETFNLMVRRLGPEQIASFIIPSVSKMALHQSFSIKMSALSIITEIFPLLRPEEKADILEKINTFFAEDSLILRRNLASKLGKLCKYIAKDTLQAEIFNHFKNLTNDDSDSVRIITIESLIELAKVFSNEENKTFVIPLIIQMTGDKSWRVKLVLAKCFADLAEAVGNDIAENSLISIFSTLLRDPENEVRIAAVKSLKKFVLLLSLEKIQSILAYLQTLAKDAVSLVRTGVCEVLSEILKMNLEPLGKEVTKVRIQPIITELVNDKDIEVKIEALKLLPHWAKWVNTYVLDLITNGTFALAFESPNWRIRHAIIESFIAMACEFQNQKLFDKIIKKVISNGLHDKAYKVRLLSISSFEKFSRFLEDAYVIDNLLKDLIRVSTEHSEFYSYRVTSIYGMEAIICSLHSKDRIKDQYVKTLIKLTEDTIPNIRQVTVRVLIGILQHNTFPEYYEPIRKLLDDLRVNDKDSEVRLMLGRVFK
jgi:serine/threonine-protein phosphatase 2A regulatory subunit A